MRDNHHLSIFNNNPWHLAKLDRRLDISSHYPAYSAAASSEQIPLPITSTSGSAYALSDMDASWIMSSSMANYSACRSPTSPREDSVSDQTKHAAGADRLKLRQKLQLPLHSSPENYLAVADGLKTEKLSPQIPSPSHSQNPAHGGPATTQPAFPPSAHSSQDFPVPKNCPISQLNYLASNPYDISPAHTSPTQSKDNQHYDSINSTRQYSDYSPQAGGSRSLDRQQSEPSGEVQAETPPKQTEKRKYKKHKDNSSGDCK